ncbi:hypothetical protein CL3_17870 [butyrate-producing bacterium SM4/1]|nr:hypothetical protein CLS_09060 [[Clostridium] cf. saccharolyticum K10]CBL36282.1 hypothetical protein CL3_17870 [butyrate-producing bacterium SM4/1]
MKEEMKGNGAERLISPEYKTRN